MVVESTYSCYWLVDGLVEQGYAVHLANTLAIQQYNGLKYTNDETDARFLAHLLRLNILPTGYIYPKAQRQVRDLLRRRLLLVKQRTAHYAAIWDPTIKRYYQRKCKRKPVMVAKKTVANKLTRACYHMLRDGTTFDVTRAFG